MGVWRDCWNLASDPVALLHQFTPMDGRVTFAFVITDGPTAAVVHAVFEYAGIGLGATLYRQARRSAGLAQVTAPGSFALIVGLLIGAALGNKLVFIVERPDLLLAWWQGGEPLRLGQSIVGGLLGGLIGIELAKVLTRQPASTGDLMVLPIAAGLALGRIGCFVAGLHDDTYGLPTTLPWGVDVGDGLARHPTALYEIVVVLLLAAALHRARGALSVVPGLAFKLLMAGYLIWRLLGDNLKPVRVAYLEQWSGIQMVCCCALLIYMPIVVRSCFPLCRRS